MSVFYELNGTDETKIYKINDGALVAIIDCVEYLIKLFVASDNTIWAHYDNTRAGHEGFGLVKVVNDAVVATIPITDTDIKTGRVFYDRDGTFVVLGTWFDEVYKYTVAADNTITRVLFGHLTITTDDTLALDGDSLELCIFDNCSHHFWGISHINNVYKLCSLSLYTIKGRDSIIKTFELTALAGEGWETVKIRFNKDHHIYIWATVLFYAGTRRVGKSKLLKFDIYSGVITTLFTFEYDAVNYKGVCSLTGSTYDKVERMSYFALDAVNDRFIILCEINHPLTVRNPVGTSGQTYPDSYDFESLSFVILFEHDAYVRQVILDDQTAIGTLYHTDNSRETDYNLWGWTDGYPGSFQSIAVDDVGNFFISGRRQCAGWMVYGYIPYYVYFQVTFSGAFTIHYLNDIGSLARSNGFADTWNHGKLGWNSNQTISTSRIFEVTPNG